MPHGRLAALWSWGGLAARLVVGGVWVAAGALKFPDPAESVRAVRAFQLLPESVVPATGHALPILELVIGAMLLIGFATRVVGGISVLLQLAFIVGISSAWARGLQIDCGCFGGGGGTVADATASYRWDIARDVGLLALSALLAVFPRTALGIDKLLTIDKEPTT